MNTADTAQPEDTGDNALITLPFFLGRRTTREFRRLFTSVLAFSLPLVIAAWGYQYLEERSTLPKIVASSTMASDMWHLGRLVGPASQGSTTALDQLSQRSRSLSESLKVLQDDEPLPALWGESTIRAERTANIAALVQQAQLVAQRSKDMQDLESLTLQMASDSERMDAEVRALHSAIQSGLDHNDAGWVAEILLRALLLIALVGLLYLRFSKQDLAQRQADNLRQNAVLRLQWAEAATQEAQQANETVQLAIFRLMQELQDIASGDLTKKTTVGEDITGGIADAINYTVEELRALVTGVLRTAERVTSTAAQVDATSLVLLESSRNQLAAMRGVGQSVVHLAGQVDAVSVQAQASAEVARQSRAAAQSGLSAVEEAISSINTLRDHVHETSKRIKRLGESSQEIGEITALISEITGQTNLLAVNAAIQAASAGEAGRGFSVVAEEVGQLAERCANAARQIRSLVLAIQTDAQNAIGAMERSAQGVVEGTRLSDRAGLALKDINQLSEDVSARIEQIATVASKEADSANAVANSMQGIVSLIEQTSHGTQLNADKVRGLRSAADDLRESVTRFNVA
jgi:twitching motility protein PilJ